jgi:hypothetical protein
VNRATLRKAAIMSKLTSHPLFMRNVLVLCSGVLAILGFVISSEASALYLKRPFGPTAAFFAIGMAFAAAVAARRLVAVVLRGPGIPWYVRPGAIPFLIAVVLCAAMAFAAIDVFKPTSALLAVAIPIPARLLHFLAVFLLWITVFDWPMGEQRTHRRHANGACAGEDNIATPAPPPISMVFPQTTQGADHEPAATHPSDQGVSRPRRHQGGHLAK